MSIEEALGSFAEIPDGDRKKRVILPISYYTMSVELESQGVSPDKEGFVVGVERPGKNGEADEPIPLGGAPYAQLMLTVVDGPFKDEEFSSRLYMTPGKTGSYAAFIANACRAMTHQGTNEKAYKEFDFTFE